MSFRTLFGGSPATTTPTQDLTPLEQNPTKRQAGETYHRWGLRVCATAYGSCMTLRPFLHNVYNYIYGEQVGNQALQAEQRRQKQCQIEQKRNDINHLNQQINSCQQKQNEKKEKISELKSEKQGLQVAKQKINKEAKIKLIIGLVILVPLTFYLFLFYSSTFYSAFFRNFEDGGSVMNYMFDAEALSKALATSVYELFFVLCAPIIFMGLGFSLHFFSVQKTWTKYLKMAAIITVTFVFDAILAYKIGAALHQIAIIYGEIPLGTPYGLTETVSDINTWAVIFCGFIVYMIWGIVFDMVMTAYSQLDLNKINIKAIDDKIKGLEDEIKEEKQREQELNAQINSNNNDIAALTTGLTQNVIIDRNAIRTEMNNFFSGWMQQMNVLGMTANQQQEASKTFEDTINILLH